MIPIQYFIEVSSIYALYNKYFTYQ